MSEMRSPVSYSKLNSGYKVFDRLGDFYYNWKRIIVWLSCQIEVFVSDCDVGNGKVFESGETFSFDRQHCVSYICEGTMYKVKKAKCFDVDSNKCVDPGTLVKRKGCVVVECVERDTKFGAVIHFKHKEVQCPIGDKCYPDGDTVTYNGKQCK
ncbi:hypothetical protein LOTGIDRAFT_157598, partial [Lottia gigantea]